MANPFESSGDSGGSDNVNDEPELADSFEDQVRKVLSGGNGLSLLDIPTVTFKNNIDEIDDKELLEEVLVASSESSPIKSVVEDRLSEINGSLPSDSDLTGSEQVTTEVTEVESKMSNQSVEVSDIAANALTPEEAVEKEHQWRILIWGPPGVGKTHFSYTMPEPVCIIDTEGNAHDIAHKFDKEFYLWQVSNYDESMDALTEALDVLHAYRKEADVTGSIVVDSMSDLWTQSQQKYVKEYYGPNKDVSDVEFSSGFGGGQSDWKKIKEYHNVKFRQPMLDSPFHLCWTAMSEEDYEAAIEEGTRRDKPAGEKENIYKVDHIVHIGEDDAGIRRADVEKSGLIKHRFAGLEDPTFEKLEGIIYDIDEAETSDNPVDIEEVTDFDIELYKGNPRFVTDNE